MHVADSWRSVQLDVSGPRVGVQALKPSDGQIEARFRYHRPNDAARSAHDRVTEASIRYAKEIRDAVPECRELEQALDVIVQARMLANAGIATNHDKLPAPKASR